MTRASLISPIADGGAPRRGEGAARQRGTVPRGARGVPLACGERPLRPSGPPPHLRWGGFAHLVLVFLWLIPAAAFAQAIPDGPELSAPGPYAVGVTAIDLVRKDAPSLTAPGGRADRTLPLTVWFPATGGTAHARYLDHAPGAQPQGREAGAFADAKPVRGKAFPLVVLSHGYKNWATGFSDLAEGLASRGYVVAAIDHRDLDPPVPQQVSFGEVVLDRSADQRFVIAELTRRAGSGPLAGVYDPTRVALIGYSMGGFGAVETAGAGLDPASPLAKLGPPGLFDPQLQGAPSSAPPSALQAVVLFAPWGGAAPLRAFGEAGLAQVKAPTLVVVGDHDDVSGYDGGVKWIYDHLTGADRRMLVYQNAHHNIVGDGIVSQSERDFIWAERLEEPVWRRDRILSINRHFVTAFLDATLKGDAAHAAFLNVPTVRADEGVWPLAQGQSVGAAFAAPTDEASKGYWPGFHRRWALGLELHHDAATVSR